MADAPAAGKLWGGRFSGATDPLMTAYNESIHFDRALYAHDIAGSVAFARANVATGVLTPDEFAAIERGLGQVRAEWEAGTFKIVGGVDEDIHTANERRLGELIGSETAGKLHTYDDTHIHTHASPSLLHLPSSSTFHSGSGLFLTEEPQPRSVYDIAAARATTRLRPTSVCGCATGLPRSTPRLLRCWPPRRTAPRLSWTC